MYKHKMLGMAAVVAGTVGSHPEDVWGGLMVCPKCGSYNVIVIDSRPADAMVNRRRKCCVCDYRFNTVEVNTDNYDRLVQLAVLMEKVRDMLSIMDTSWTKKPL